MTKKQLATWIFVLSVTLVLSACVRTYEEEQSPQTQQLQETEANEPTPQGGYLTEENNVQEQEQEYTTAENTGTQSQTPSPSPTIFVSMAPLTFDTVEAFMYAYKAAKEGRAAPTRPGAAGLLKLTEINKLHLLTDLPEEYHLVNIQVSEYTVTLVYAHESLSNEEATSIPLHNERSLKTISLSISRQSDPHVTTQVPTYSEIYNTLEWVQNNTYFYLQFPSRYSIEQYLSVSAFGYYDTSVLGENIIGINEMSQQELLDLAKTMTIDLTDEALIDSMIGDFQP